MRLITYIELGKVGGRCHRRAPAGAAAGKGPAGARSPSLRIRQTAPTQEIKFNLHRKRL